MEGGVWKFTYVSFQGSHYVYGTDAKGLCSHRHLVGSSLLTTVLQFCFSKGLSVVCFPLGSATYVASTTMNVCLTHLLRFKRELWFQGFDEESIYIFLCFLNHWRMSGWGNPLTRLPLHYETTSY